MLRKRCLGDVEGLYKTANLTTKIIRPIVLM